MSIAHLPKGFFRKTTNAFLPKTIIDTLYDYGEFLSSHSTIATGGLEAQRKVLVIGAGAAGLAAAYELSKIKRIDGKPALSITLAEATGRLGGRMDSQVFKDAGFNDKIFELGCMRFPPTSTTLYHYFKEFGIQPTPNFPDPGKVKTELYYMNNVYEWPAGKSTPDSPLFQRLGKDFSSIVTYLLGDPNNVNYTNPAKLFDYWAIYDRVPTETNKAAVIRIWQGIINCYKDVSFYEGVFQLANNPAVIGADAIPWTTSDMNAFGALGVGSGGFGPLFSVNFVEIIRLFANGWEDNQELVPDGIRSLVNAFETRLRAAGVEILLNQPLTFTNDTAIDDVTAPANTLRWVSGVTCNDVCYKAKFGNGKVACYDAVVVATRTRAMEMMNLTISRIKPTVTPSNVATQYLSQTPEAAVSIRNLHLMSSSKLFVLTKKKFWYAENNKFREDLVQNIQSDGLFRGLYCLNYDGNTQKGGMGVVLISYVWGDDSDRLLALSAQERYQKFFDVIRQISPNFASALEESRLTGLDPAYPWETGRTHIDWQATPYQYGAFKLNLPGQDSNCHDSFFQYQANLASHTRKISFWRATARPGLAAGWKVPCPRGSMLHVRSRDA